MTLSRKRSLFCMPESAFATDPDTDGSDYQPITCLEIGDLVDAREWLETKYQTGRAYDTSPILGKDGWSLTFKTPLIGLSALAGDAGSPPADDWLDVLLTHTFGTQAAVDGEGLGSSSTTSDLILDSDNLGRQDLVPVYEAGVATPERSHWLVTTSDAGDASYDFAPTAPGSYTTAAIQYGVNNYRPNPEDSATLAFVYNLDGTEYTLLGGRVSGLTFTLDAAGGMWTADWTVSGDNLTQGSTHSSLPTIGGSDFILANTPVRGVSSPVYFNDSAITAVSSITIDLGLETGEIMATSGANGQSGMEIRSMAPTVTVTPTFASGNLTLKRDATEGRLLVQMGAGVPSGGKLNSLAFHAENAICQEVTLSDDNGKQRQSLQFKVTDVVRVATAIEAVFCQLSRA